MLKIKDEVDLKELEKVGFEEDKELSDNCTTVYSMKMSYQKLCFEKENLILYLYEPFHSNVFILKNDIIYDLIQAGYVEKVGD